MEQQHMIKQPVHSYKPFYTSPLSRCVSMLGILMLGTPAVYASASSKAVGVGSNTASDVAPSVANASVEQQYQPSSPEACIALESSAERLNCYDSFYHKPATTAAATVGVTPEQVAVPAARNNTAVVLKDQTSVAAAKPDDSSEFTAKDVLAKINPLDWAGKAPKFDPSVSLLDRRWELSEAAKLGTFHIRAYKPFYVLPVFYASSDNNEPRSPNPDNTATTSQDNKHVEGKFQISLKTKAIEGVVGDYGDLWLGYTQSSHWQLYNGDNSRPFRETNYEPEASLIFKTNYNLLGLNGRLIGLSLNHQSNGRSLPLSRSWNRAILNIGFERDNFALMLRPWYRFKEATKDNDNKDIENYIGRGDVQAFYKYKDHEFSLMLRHSLTGGDNSRGAVQVDWAFPINNSLRGYVQVFDGYGESLIDYNHRATYIGLGVSLLNWY